MRTAIYIEEGVVQLVITPETEFEKSAIKSFSDKQIESKVFSGSFYDCRGGWIKQKGYYNSGGYQSPDNNDQSLIIKAIKVDETQMVSSVSAQP